MAGASSRRGKADRKNKQPNPNNPPPGQGRAPANPPATQQPAQPKAPTGSDGPKSSAPPSTGGPGRQSDVGPSAPEQSVRSGSRDPSPSGAATAAELSAADALRERQKIFNRNVDFAGNAYNMVALEGDVSQKKLFLPYLPHEFLNYV